MSEAFDIAIIGGGPGGYSTALRAAELGKRVAMIERDATLGGTCLNRGCIPSKALISATHAIDSIRHAGELGISATINGIDYGTLHDYKKRIVDTMTQGLAGLLAHRGVTVFRGVASITGAARPITVHIAASADGQDVQRSVRSDVPEDIGPSYDITAQDVVLAMGSVPRQLPGEPFRGAIIDSTRAMSMAMPHNAVIIGAGAIAAEFASMWNAAGCKVTMLIRKDRVLSGWDRRAGVTLTRELKRHGIDVIDRFKGDNRLFVAGSTWEPDEELLIRLINDNPDVKFVVAPHEMDESRIARLMAETKGGALRYTQCTPRTTYGSRQLLILDTVGILSSVYSYATWSYIGGGFGVGIHNTLEAATFGLPVAFGPNYQKFKEARDLVTLGAARSINDYDELRAWFVPLRDNEEFLQKTSRIAKDYTTRHQGATGIIVRTIFN